MLEVLHPLHESFRPDLLVFSGIEETPTKLFVRLSPKIMDCIPGGIVDPTVIELRKSDLIETRDQPE